MQAAATKKGTVKKVSGGARIVDAVLAVVFLGLAINSGWWFWWVSAVLCVVTATTSPLEKLHDFVKGKFVAVQKAR